MMFQGSGGTFGVYLKPIETSVNFSSGGSEWPFQEHEDKPCNPKPHSPMKNAEADSAVAFATLWDLLLSAAAHLLPLLVLKP